MEETSVGGVTSLETSETVTSESMVILVQQGDDRGLTMPMLTTGNNTLDQQVITLVSEGFGGGTEDDLTTLSTSEQGLTLVEDREGSEIVADLLGSVVDNEDFSASEQRTGTFETDDGQILYVTYTVNPSEEETNLEGGGLLTDQQRMILHVSEDGSTVMLPAEEELGIGCGGTDVVPQFTVDSVYSLAPTGVFKEEELPTTVEETKNISKETPKMKPRLFFELNNRCRTEQLIASSLHIEEKLQVLDAMLTPVPQKVRRDKKEVKKGKDKVKEGTEDGESEKGSYVCDLCGASFPRAAQYYGHLHSHSGERKWECTLCPTEVEFQSQSQLRRHEKQCHLNLRPHTCSLCPARFDRASQLSYHERRIHAGERPHVCQICHKSFFKRSDLRSHLNIHLGISKSICETCGKKFNHVSNLIRHTRMHSGNPGIKPYPCTVCGKRFTQLNAMHQHKSSHQTGKDVSCSMCSKMFKSHTVMRKHARHMHGDKDNNVSKPKLCGQTRRYYCKVCGESFEFASLLKDHENQHEKENSFHCNCCGQDYGTVDLLKTHSCQTPEERLQRQAEAAAEQLSLNSQLESLLQEHSGLMADDGELIIYVTQEGQSEPTQVHIKPLSSTPELKPVMLYDCKGESNTCVESTESNSIANNQDSSCEMLLFEGNTTETQCVAPAADNSNNHSLRLELHLDSMYMNVGSPPTSPLLQHNSTLGDSPADHFMTCGAVLLDLEQDPECKNQSVDPLEITNHDCTITLNDVKNEDRGTEVTSDSDSKKKKARVYQCPECPKTFLKNSNFKQHLGTHFIDQMNYSCPTCGQYFAWKSTLNKHILRSHATVPPPRCRCEICHREYASAGQVQEHIKRDHFKQRPHACPVCKKTFYKKYDLTIHFRTHTKERPYICGTCGKSFYHLSHIIRHERIHSGHRPYKCNDCGRQFNQSSSLKSHRQRHIHNAEKKNQLEVEGLELPVETVQVTDFPIDQGNILLF